MAARIFTSITQDDDWPSGWLPYDSGTEAGPAFATSVLGGCPPGRRTTGTLCTKFEHAVWREEIYIFTHRAPAGVAAHRSSPFLRSADNPPDGRQHE